MAMEFAAWLRRQLARRDWTQADFARAAGLPTGTVSRWVRGERVPTPLHADLIADVLGVDLDIVLAVAGHRPNVDPDDPPEIADLIAMIRKTQMHPDRVAGLRWQRADQLARMLAARPVWQATGLVIDRGDGRHLHPATADHRSAILAERDARALRNVWN